MKIGDIFECDDGIFPQEAMDLCRDGKAYIENAEPITKLVEEEFLLAPAEYDEEGNLISEEQYGTKQVEKTIRRFQVVAIPEPTEEELQARALAMAKSERADAVSNITVEVDGLVFDGDEKSQERMARSIVALNDGETITWVLHDNTIANVTKEQLKTALRLAGQKQTELWTKPYENSVA